MADSIAARARRDERLAPALIAALARDGGGATGGVATPLQGAHVFTYLADLTAAVAALRDPRALDALWGALPAGGIAIDAVAALGDPAVPRVLDALDDPRLRVAAWQTLSRLLAGDAVGPRSRAALVDALRAGLQDDAPGTRAAAIASLTDAADPATIELVERIARSDPWQASRGGETVYPLREAARRWLERHRPTRL